MLCCKVHESGDRSMRSLFSILLVFAVVSCVVFHQVLIKSTAQHNFTGMQKKPEPRSQDCGKYLKVTLWDKEVCQKTFENLVKFPTFPLYPDSSYCTNNLSSVVEKIQRTCIKRIQTYFGPIETGFYKLRVRSSIAVRIFLKTHHQSPEASLVLEHPGTTNGNTMYSKSFFLKSRYYFEIVLFCPESLFCPGSLFCQPRKDFFNVDWLVPGATEFRSIQTRDLVPEGTRDLISEGHVVSSEYSVFHSSKNVSQKEHSLFGYVSRIHVTKSFPPCSLVNVTALQNVTEKITVYAPPSSPPEFIKDVLRVIMQSFQRVVPSKYPSSKIIKVESTLNSTPVHARRLLVDLDLEVDGLDHIERFSEYFLTWYHGNQLRLCRPLRHRWNRFVALNFVFLSNCYQNESIWVNYFIQNMIELLQTSLDVHLKVVVTTCDESRARDYDSRLRSSGFDRYAVVLLEGVYSESRGMKAALSVVEENNSIVVLCDSRINMPTVIIEEIRKHSFKNTMAYSPVPYRLDCGYFPDSEPLKGNWCPQCGALLALYKEDWERVFQSSSNGLNTQGLLKDRKKLVRHISKIGIEVIQVEINNLYLI